MKLIIIYIRHFLIEDIINIIDIIIIDNIELINIRNIIMMDIMDIICIHNITDIIINCIIMSMDIY